MPYQKIDTLRKLVAAIGTEQAAYWEFFPDFSYRLEKELGEYLGEPSCVALSSATGPFSFHQIYRHEGLEFEGGKFRVPLMIRLNNLNDEGQVAVRIRLYFVKTSTSLSAEIKGEKPITVDTSDLTPLLEYVYRYLEKSLSHSNWFTENASDYHDTRIGFRLK